MRDIKEIEEDIRSRQQCINKLNKEIIVFQRELLETKTGFKPDDIVEDREGRRGALCHCEGYTPSSWYWRRFKKDGTLYKSVEYLPPNVILIEKKGRE